MTRFIFTFSFVAFVLIAQCGCRQKSKSPYQPATLQEIRDPSQAASVNTEVTEEQAQAFAARLHTAISNNDISTATNLVLVSRIVDRVVHALDLSSGDETGFRKGINGNNPIKIMMVELAAAVNQGGTYKLIRTAVRGNARHVIFRFIDVDQSMNYHDIRLVLDGGTVKGDQLFVAATGESLTETLIAAVRPAIESQQSLTGRISGDADQKVKDLEKQKEMMLAAQAGDSAKVQRLYKTLPKEVQDQKATQIFLVQAAQTLPDEQYVAAMTEFANRFPGDPSVALMSFDRAILQEDLEGLKSCIADLNKWTGGDDYLTLMSAAIAAQWGATDYAKQLYQNIDSATINDAVTHEFRLTAALLSKDYSVVVEELRIMESEYDVIFPLHTGPEFADFVKSPEFAEYKSK